MLRNSKRRGFFVFVRRKGEHERVVAILFMVALGALTVSLVDFVREVRIALTSSIIMPDADYRSTSLSF
jgi:hypothetical protein